MNTRTKQAQSYDDLIAADLLPSTTIASASPSAETSEPRVLFDDPFPVRASRNTRTATISGHHSFGRRRSVSQGLEPEAQGSPAGSVEEESLGLWDDYNSKRIDTLLGNLTLSSSRERAESDFGRYTSISKTTPSASTMQLQNVQAQARPAEENLQAVHQRSQSPLPQRRSPLNMERRRQKKEDWICLACGNKNYSWRMVCNMRKCRAPKPGHLQESVPPGSWACIACGNLNYAERLVCNMRKCRAPRPTTPSFMGTLQGFHHQQQQSGYDQQQGQAFNVGIPMSYHQQGYSFPQQLNQMPMDQSLFANSFFQS